MSDHRTRIVKLGYDRLAGRFAEWAGAAGDDPRDEMVRRFSERLPPRARVLDMGCGGGLPSTAELARQFEVTGVDVSAAQIEAARRNVPQAQFVEGDLLDLRLPDGSFEGVAALYSLSHLPRDRHYELFQRVFRWLTPDGVFLATLGATDIQDWIGDWLGVPMFFSAFDADTNRGLLRDAGFELLVDEVRATEEPEGSVDFLWAIARRPPGP